MERGFLTRDEFQRSADFSAADGSSPFVFDPGYDGPIQFVEGNAELLESMPDNSFDAYTISFGLRNVTDIPAGE